MEKKISIIIPAHNSESTVIQCLNSIYRENALNYDVILVNDNSSDLTVEKAKSFPCNIISLNENKGAAEARNTGAKQAKGDILLFVDSDVMLPEKWAEMIIDTFKTDTEVSAVQAVYTKESPVSNIPTLTRDYYKYHKVMRVSDRYIGGLNSFCFAIRKEAFDAVGGFRASAEGTEDVDLGSRLTKAGYKIALNKSLQVAHLKHYTFFSLLKCDYKKIKAKAKLMFSNRQAKNNEEVTFSLNKKKDMIPEFLSIGLSMLFACGMLSFVLLKQAGLLYASLVFGLLFIALSSAYLNTIRRNRGMIITALCLPVYYAEMLTAQVSLIDAAFEYYVFKRKRL